MGHEVTGRVVEAGAGAEEHLGKRVAAETYFYTCDGCPACRAGRRNLCPERRSIGSHVNGGFARFVLVPARNLHEVHPSCERARRRPLRAALVRHAVPVRPCGGLARRYIARRGSRAMGILCAQALRAQRAPCPASGMPSDRRRLDVAASLGFDVVEAPGPGRAPSRRAD